MPAKCSVMKKPHILTYIYNNWGNNGTEVTPEMVEQFVQNNFKN